MRRMVLTAFIALLSLAAVAQQGINYQAALRNTDGQPLANREVGLRLTLLDGSNAAVYQETQTTTTSSLGILNVTIGNGYELVGKFANIDWSQPLTLQVEVDADTDGQNYVALEATPLRAVPQAHYARQASSLRGADERGVSVSAPQALPEDSALFEVRNKRGQVVFAVYENGTRVYVDESSRGTRGGFAVAGFDSRSGRQAKDLLVVTPDSTRIYVDGSDQRGTRGGFAVAGFDSRAGAKELLVVTPDSTRVYVDGSGQRGTRGGFAVAGFDSRAGGHKDVFFANADSTRVYINTNTNTNGQRGTRGGFAVAGFDSRASGGNDVFFANADSTRVYVHDGSSRGTRGGFAVAGFDSRASQDKYMDITKENYIIGHGAGKALMSGGTFGKNNSIMGTNAGAATTGSRNVYIGNNAALKNWVGEDNVVIGTDTYSEAEDGNNNVLIGNSVAQNTTLRSSVVIGYQAGKGNPDATNVFNSVAIGVQAGYNNIGLQNVFVGHKAGMNNDNGLCNVMLGNLAGQNNTKGSSNVFLGDRAGEANTEGNNNIFIGKSAAWRTQESNNSIFIGTGNNDSFTNQLDGSVSLGNLNLYDLKIPADASIGQCVFIGNYVGYQLSGQCKYVQCNTFIGDQVGNSMHPPSFGPYTDELSHNIAIGYGSGTNAGGYGSVYLGYMSGYESDGERNMFLGETTGYYLKGNGNIMLGAGSGYDIEGNDNLFLGKASGRYSRGSNNIYIGSVWGYENELLQESNTLRIAGSGKDNYIYATGSIMELKGNVTSNTDNGGSLGTSDKRWSEVYATNGIINTSDRRLKTDIRPLENALSKIMKLNGITYKWRTSEFPKMNFDSKQHAGVIAQEVEAVLPEAVETGTDGYKSVNYSTIVPLLIEGMKEQQQVIDKQQQQIDELKKLVEQLMKK